MDQTDAAGVLTLALGETIRLTLGDEHAPPLEVVSWSAWPNLVDLGPEPGQGPHPRAFLATARESGYCTVKVVLVGPSGRRRVAPFALRIDEAEAFPGAEVRSMMPGPGRE